MCASLRPADLPYAGLFRSLVAHIAPLYFSMGDRAVIETAYEDVCRWPAAVTGRRLHLPVAGMCLNFRVPCITARDAQAARRLVDRGGEGSAFDTLLENGGTGSRFQTALYRNEQMTKLFCKDASRKSTCCPF